MNSQANLEAFSPAEYIREELEARGWTHLDFAEVVGMPVQAVSEFIVGDQPISPEIAALLGEAFGTSADLWLNLESAYQTSRVSAKNDSVVR